MCNLRKSSCKLTRGNKSLPKHKTIVEDLDNITQDFKTVTLGLLQNRHTALTSVNVQTRLWFLSAAVASVKFPLCCSFSCATFGLFFPCLTQIYLLIRITNSHCLQDNIKLSMKIKLLCKISHLALCSRSPSLPGW